jgi:hypothetical protein
VTFSNGQRVKVTEGDDAGKTGTVVRVRRGDDGAWIRLDTEPAHPNFLAQDERHNDVMLYPEQVKAGA